MFQHKNKFHSLGDFRCAPCGPAHPAFLTHYDLAVHEEKVHGKELVLCDDDDEEGGGEGSKVPRGLERVVFPDGKVGESIVR